MLDQHGPQPDPHHLAVAEVEDRERPPGVDDIARGHVDPGPSQSIGERQEPVDHRIGPLRDATRSVSTGFRGALTSSAGVAIILFIHRRGVRLPNTAGRRGWP